MSSKSETLSISKLQAKSTASIAGRVLSIRTLGKICFLTLEDFTGQIQVVLSQPELIETAQSMAPQSIVQVEGEVLQIPQPQQPQQLELQAHSLELIQKVTATPPIQLESPTVKEKLETLLEHRAISLRHKKIKPIFQIQAAIVQYYREFMLEFGCTEIFTPLMLASSSEGGSEIFEIEYFDKKATLAQSAQLYKQVMVGVFDRVFGLSKCFRAENSNTRRHTTEATQFEFEIGYIKDFSDVMQAQQECLRYILEKLYRTHKSQLEILGARQLMLPKGDFPCLTFDQACQLLEKQFQIQTQGWDDLSTEAERLLCEYARQQHGSDFIFVRNFKKAAFYAYKDEQGTYHNVDLLCKEMEISSGGRRIDSHSQLEAAIREAGMDPKDFQEYLSIFQFGMPPHGGFGMGLERLTMLICDVANIREATLFPSDPTTVASQKLA